MSKTRRSSIKIKTVIVIFSALIIGVISYFLFFSTGEYIVSKYYDSQNNIEYEFQAFVEENAISSLDKDKIQEWCKKKSNVYCVVFDDNTQKLIDDTDMYEYTFLDTMNSYRYYSTEIQFSDGIYEVAIIEYSEDKIMTVIYLSSFVISIVIALVIILIYLSSLVNRITNISRQATLVSCDINHSISKRKKHRDEIDDLYTSIEDMRCDIIEHYEKQKRTEAANRELITNMSHDIRTPLTSIIGYNEMMVNENCSMEELKQYASYSLEKAKQLKEMSNRLFEYSLIYESGKIKVKKESFDASLLLQQLIGENLIILRQKGYEFIVNDNINALNGYNLSTDATVLKRVFDNIFSNISKYADSQKPIYININVFESRIIIEFKNSVKESFEESTSTKIGLKCCERLMFELGGSITAYSQDKTYISKIVI